MPGCGKVQCCPGAIVPWSGEGVKLAGHTEHAFDDVEPTRCSLDGLSAAADLAPAADSLEHGRNCSFATSMAWWYNGIAN